MDEVYEFSTKLCRQKVLYIGFSLVTGVAYWGYYVLSLYSCLDVCLLRYCSGFLAYRLPDLIPHVKFPLLQSFCYCGCREWGKRIHQCHNDTYNY